MINKKENLFCESDELGCIYLRYVFVYFEEEPLIFISINDKNDLFLCLCYDIRNKQDWVMSKTNIKIIKQLIYRDISIYEAFKAVDDNKWLISYNGKDTSIINVLFNSIDNDSILPPKNLKLKVFDVYDELNFINTLENGNTNVMINENIYEILSNINTKDFHKVFDNLIEGMIEPETELIDNLTIRKVFDILNNIIGDSKASLIIKDDHRHRGNISTTNWNEIYFYKWSFNDFIKDNSIIKKEEIIGTLAFIIIHMLYANDYNKILLKEEMTKPLHLNIIDMPSFLIEPIEDFNYNIECDNYTSYDWNYMCFYADNFNKKFINIKTVDFIINNYKILNKLLIKNINFNKILKYEGYDNNKFKKYIANKLTKGGIKPPTKKIKINFRHSLIND